MVCIIDDREDVWNMATNLIQVKPYHFFQHTGDINAPPGMSKHELDGKGVDFTDLEEKAKRIAIDKKTDGTEEAIESTENASSNASEEVIQAEAKEKDDIPKTPEHVIDENVDVVEDYSPESAGGDEAVPGALDEANNDNENTTDEASTKTEHSKESETINVTESGGESNNENATEKTDLVIKSPSDTAGDDNLIEIEDPDDYLLYLEAILMKIHSRFYEYYDEHKQVYSECKFYFVFVPSITVQFFRRFLI